MFGNIINSTGSRIYVLNKTHKVLLNYKEVHVVFDEGNHKFVGQIDNVTEDSFSISILGEIINNKYQSGFFKGPKENTIPRVINGYELSLIIGKQDLNDNSTLLIGKSVLYPNFNVTAKLDTFFSNHFAIIGNSGSGKSCGAARLLQNLFYSKIPPKNAHIVLFDAYGEYDNAFSKLSSIPQINYRSYKNSTLDEANGISIPPYFLDADSLAILLDIDDSNLIPILEKTLQYVNVFKSNTPKSAEYKNNILASSILEILLSGKKASQIRDQILSILNKFGTDEINESSEIKELGYSRTLKQCLNLDGDGKINDISKVIDFLNNYKKLNISKYDVTADITYNLEDIYDALDFALLSEGIYTNSKMYESSSVLKTHLYQIINSPFKKYFVYNDIISKEEYIRRMFLTKSNEEAQIINISLDSLDDRLAKILTKLYSKLFFEYVTSLSNRGSFPINIILEEAHRYVNDDKDRIVIGYNIFDRITKEGRKYGLLMGFITQRPSELSQTSLSQCSNFLVFRLFHPEDYNMIDRITNGLTNDSLDRLKNLRNGVALAFGNAFSVPFLVSIDLPDPLPLSNNVKISNTWYN